MGSLGCPHGASRDVEAVAAVHWGVHQLDRVLVVNGFFVFAGKGNLLKSTLSELNDQDGYLILSDRNALTFNISAAGDGIAISGNKNIAVEASGGSGAAGNTLSSNAASGHAIDLVDENGECVSNRWSRNAFATKTPDCIR